MSFATLSLCLGVLELNGIFRIRRTKPERVLGKKLHEEVFLVFGNKSIFWNSLLTFTAQLDSIKKVLQGRKHY